MTLLGATSCAGDDLDDDTASGDKGSVTLGSQSFTEAAVVATMYQLLLEDAGYEVDLKLVENRDAYMREMPGDVQISADYLGGVLDYLATQAEQDPVTTGDADASLEAGATLLEDKGLTLLDHAEATDQNAFFVTQEYADENGVATLSDLEGKSVVLAAHSDCKPRADCAAGLEQEYGITVSKVLPLGFASPATYKSVKDGESQLGLTSTTDATLSEQGLVLLVDDKAIQPAQNLVPVVSTAFLDDHPDVEEVLNALMETITTDDLITVNRQAGVERLKVEDVARDYLEEEGLL